MRLQAICSAGSVCYLFCQGQRTSEDPCTCRALYYCEASVYGCPEELPGTSIQPGAANIFAVVGNTAEAPLVETPSGLPALARKLQSALSTLPVTQPVKHLIVVLVNTIR